MARQVQPATLLLLAGGASRRMGRPKALLPVGGATLAEWVAGRLAPGFAHLLVAAAGPEQLPPGLRPHLVRDLHRGAGPLAGVEAGLAASPHDTVVAVACDMPAVTADLVSRLAAAAAPSCASGGSTARTPRSSPTSTRRRTIASSWRGLHRRMVREYDRVPER